MSFGTQDTLALIHLTAQINKLTHSIKADTERLSRIRLQKYDPGQPRVPRGNSDGQMDFLHHPRNPCLNRAPFASINWMKGG